MKIAGVKTFSSDNTKFGALRVHTSFYDKEAVLCQNRQTGDMYQKLYKDLEEISGDKNLEIRGLGDCGGVVVETDDRGNIIRYISKNFHNVVSCMKDAVLKLAKENEIQSKEKRKPFQGNY
ncbi:MAG: hypothetical protein ACI37R_00015 [Candidatus Avigastranaerophilus sp.]